MHQIYSAASQMSTFPVVFNLEWLLEKHKCEPKCMCKCVCEPKCKRACQCGHECEHNQKHTLLFIEFWLNSIARNSAGSPVILIGTHKDKIANNKASCLAKSNAELAKANDLISQAHQIIGNCITRMQVYKSKKLNLKVPEEQPSS